MHQGDRDGVKGVYHINAVDEVTQGQVVACVPQISEAWLLSALIAMLDQFPFKIRGFHSDNGSEFINPKTHERYAHRQAECIKMRLWKCRAVENQKQVFLPSHIPTASTTMSLFTPKQMPPGHHPYPSGSSFNEKMLSRPGKGNG